MPKDFPTRLTGSAGGFVLCGRLEIGKLPEPECALGICDSPWFRLENIVCVVAYKVVEYNYRVGEWRPRPKTGKIELRILEALWPCNPTKHQMRLMMQSLLAERFHLAVHCEAQEMPVYALTLIKPGKLGQSSFGTPADLRAMVPTEPAGGLDPDAEVFPPICYVQAGWRNRKGHMVAGSRNTTMALLAFSLSGAWTAGRPVVDRSGITGRIDYRMEWTPESNGPGPPGEEVQADSHPVTFMDAVREQPGLRLRPMKARV